MRTVSEIAAILDVEPTIAYGLINFMRTKGFIVAGKANKPAGKKGKVASTYSFDHTSIEKLARVLKALVDNDINTLANFSMLV